jgi:hypothetical protein
MDRAIGIAISQLAGTHNQDSVFMFDAVVNSIDKPNRMCNVTKVGGETSGQLDVRLMASKDDGCYVIPMLDSNVIVIGSNNVTPFVAQFSEVDSIEWLGGENDGVPLVNPLLEKLNNLENLLNDLISKYNSHTHTSACTAGGATTLPTVTLETDIITPTQKQDIEHTKIKQ